MYMYSRNESNVSNVFIYSISINMPTSIHDNGSNLSLYQYSINLSFFQILVCIDITPFPILMNSDKVKFIFYFPLEISMSVSC